MKTASIARTRTLLRAAVLAGTCLLIPEAAMCTVQTLNASVVKQVEYYANTSSETWNCQDKPVYLRLDVSFNGSQPVEVIRDRAGMDFDTSAIPDNASIQSVELLFYVVEDFTYNIQVEFKKLNNKIGGVMPCFGKYIQIGNGFEYIESNTLTAGYNTIDLGATAASDLQAQLGANWFGVGAKMSYEGLGDTQDFAKLSAQNDPNPHQLRVTYLINGGGKTTDSGEPATTESGSWGSIKGLFR